MGVAKYSTKQGVFWKIDEWLNLPDGTRRRLQRRRIPTRELALAMIAKARAEAFEGRWFAERQRPAPTVQEIWDAYFPVCQRDRESWKTDKGRAAHLLRHLGALRVTDIGQQRIDRYRATRMKELTVRKKPPAPGSLDREVALLKRAMNYAVECGVIEKSPLATVELLREPDVRASWLNEERFWLLHDAADEVLKPIILVAFDTGMRRGEILNLRWPQVDLREKVIRLAHADTKTKQARAIYLTDRVVEALSQLPRHIRSEHVFVNPRTGKAWYDIRKMFSRAKQAAGLDGLWFHDLRRSFVTNARKANIPESVVMRMSGHRTRRVFDRYNIVDEEDVRQAVERMNVMQRVGEDQDEVTGRRGNKAG